MKKSNLNKLHELYKKEELELALSILSDLELETGNGYHEPKAELERVITQDYPITYSDEEMKSHLVSLGFTIDNTTDLVEMAINEGFRWDDVTNVWS